MRQAGGFALTILLFLGCFALAAQPSGGLSVSTEKADSLKYAALDKKLSEYCSAISLEPISIQMEESDFLIDTCKDSLVRQYVATTLYEKYRTSKIMGVESVAIHILDKWFFSGKVSFANQIELLDARIYADFNRQSLVGKKAQEITLFTKDGQSVSLFGSDEQANRFRVLFFYDVQCSKCKVETILLRNILENEDFPVEFYAVYTGSDEDAWQDYVQNRFSISPISASVSHLWDPECESDFQHKYGVLQTPRLYLIAPDNTILGRSLDAKALTIMLNGCFGQKNMDYGTEASLKMLDSVLGNKGLSVEDVKYFADHLAETALPKGDTLMFRQMSGDLLYYLSSKSSEASREGVDYLIDNYILSRSDIWKSEDDSLKIIGMAQMMDEFLSKSKPGTKLPKLKVPGELMNWKKTKVGEWKLSGLKGKYNFIIFYTDGCANCIAQQKAARDMLAFGSSSVLMNGVVRESLTNRSLRRQNRSITVLMVNVDEIMSNNPHLASELFEHFDLSTLPYIILSDSDGVVRRRYISFYDI